MNNLTTRKIVLGLLLTLVLAFGVQGIAEAADASFGNSTTVNLGSVSVSGPVTLDIETTTNRDTVTESVKLTVSQYATFVVDEDSERTYTWGEVDGDGDPADDGSITVPILTVTFSRAGVFTATISYRDEDNRSVSKVHTYYVTKGALDITFSDSVGLNGLTNGIGAKYSGKFKIHSGDRRNNPVTYVVSGGTVSTGTLYVQKGTDTTTILELSRDAGNFTASSSADVWLDMNEKSKIVTAGITPRSETETQGVYIFGTPTLTVTPESLEGPPGEAAGNTITVVVKDQDPNGRPGSGDVVASVPVKFDVVDKSATGGFLIRQDTDVGSNVVDNKNNVIEADDVPAAARTLYVRTGASAVVDFQFGTVSGTSEIRVSLVGKNVNITETVEATVTGDATTQLSISSNTRQSGNSKLFNLVALVERDGKPLRGATVTFQTRFGALSNTPTNQGKH